MFHFSNMFSAGFIRFSNFIFYLFVARRNHRLILSTYSYRILKYVLSSATDDELFPD